MEISGWHARLQENVGRRWQMNRHACEIIALGEDKQRGIVVFCFFGTIEQSIADSVGAHARIIQQHNATTGKGTKCRILVTYGRKTSHYFG